MRVQLNDFFISEYHKYVVPRLQGDEEYARTSDRGSYLWIAEFSYFNPRIRNAHLIPFPVVAIAKTKKWHRGVFLIPPIIESKDEKDLEVPIPLPPIDLSGWTDPVAKALHSVDLRLGDEPVLYIIGDPVADTAVSVNLYFESAATSGLLSIRHDYKTHLPTIRLQTALLECVYYLVEHYNHPDLTTYVAHQKEDFEWLREKLAKLEQEANNKPS